jgi:hypothetical protein
MAIIVKHKETNRIYALIGTGYGAFKAVSPSFFGGDLFPREDKGEIPVAAVTDGNGKIQWFFTDDLRVIEIDGVKIEDVLEAYQGDSADDYTDAEICLCPACGKAISESDPECPSCGLVFPTEDEAE